MLTDKSCLVVGAGGFIGFNLCRKLVGQYQKIYACDHFFSASILEQLDALNIEIIEGGVEGFICYQKKYQQIADIFYFAGNAIPALLETELERGCFSDQETLVMMLSALNQMEYPIRFIYGSSGGTVYGQSNNSPCEESQHCHPISAYGLSKLIQEHYIEFFARKLGFDYYIARISNPYGRIMTHGSKQLQGFIDNVVDKTIKEIPIEIWGDGNVIRDFIHIDDLVSALYSLVVYTPPKGIYNMGSGKPTSLNEIISIVTSLKKTIQVNKLASRQIDLKNNVLSIDKLQAAINWSPQVSLQKGIDSLLSFRAQERVVTDIIKATSRK
jgi:UDP-glucose 4-epimerase